MKRFLLLISLCTVIQNFAQEKSLSSASEFIERSSYVQINMDENEKATFKSGFGETVDFYSAEIIDLKKNEKMIGLTIESLFIIGQQGMSNIQAKETAWVGIEEIGDMITWLENYVIPNLQQAVGKKKTIKYIFNSKEIMLKFEVYDNKQIFSVILNNTNYHDKYFWTEARVKDIPKVLEVLKFLQAKK
ncbi:hypothetical protein GR160_01845 [Flavobacterium sp. Sd200]|uniref:hypothetical protein n=1 Tax=Flavobacterium sp. Sd200 TaxID=2692211 RepID=UPI0013685A31|nr:hypothetical protein [Flavobacterium sp. Sd200]MXN89957.1 hypothetical protein [Flavobacterium sp. Sd200]